MRTLCSEFQNEALRHSYWPRLGAAAMLFCLGCSDGQQIAPVSGTITFAGEPLVGASITTQPIASGSVNAGSGSFAITDAAGKFSLELVTPARQGAIVGDHRVMISRVRGDQTKSDADVSADGEVESWSDDPVVRRNVDRGWPKRFTNGSLRLSVPPGGKTDANFDLAPKKDTAKEAAKDTAKD